MLEQLAEESSPLELSILMPCLNEAETIETCVLKAQSFLVRNAVSGEVLVADNGSTDGSVMLAEKLGARVIHVTLRGYGAALIGGTSAARGTYVIMADADDSYDFSNLSPFLDRLRAGYDLVMGNRFAGRIETNAMPFLHRYLGNPVLSFLGRLFFRIPIGDFHCGLRGFRRNAILDLDLKTPGMEFASEMIVRSALQRLKIGEVPTTLSPDGRSRSPHLKTWRDGWRHLKFLLMLSPKWLFLFPGVFLSGIGLILCAALMFGPVRLNAGVVLDLKSFLAACLFVIIGVQLITFGALARYYVTVKGILPKGPRAIRLVTWCKTDNIVRIALTLIFAGGGTFAAAFYQWARVDFGNLTNPLIPRILVAGLSAVIIGVQLGFAGFLFEIFDIEIPSAAAKMNKT
jgi:glycosyltransferase involved in cell wall biosynthesis